MVGDELTQAGVDRIAGLREALGLPPRGDAPDDEVVFDTGNILFGGGGSDVLEGRGGDDVIDGDLRLHVRISITDLAGETEIATVTSLKDTVTIDGETKPLARMLLQGTVKPTQLHIVREIVNDGQEGDIDTAVFFDDFENYEIVTNADGSLTVSHVTVTDGIIDPRTGAPRISDGSDRITNVEVLQFADRMIAATNFAPTGAPMIDDATPTESFALNVDTSQIFDANGSGPISVQWQSSADGGASWTDIPAAAGGTATTFVPGETLPGQTLRVVATYIDGLGKTEQVASAPTGVVGDLWSATASAANFTGTAGDDVAVGDLNDNTFYGGTGNDQLVGRRGTDTAVFDGAPANYDFALNPDGSLQVTDRVGSEGSDTLISIERFDFGGTILNLIDGTNGVDQPLGTDAAELILGHDGNDAIRAGGGNDVIIGGGGDDFIRAHDGDDLMIWHVGGGRDFMLGTGGTDTALFIGSNAAETFAIYTRAEAILAGLTPQHDAVEILITRNGEIIGELNSIEELVIDGNGGGDTFQVFGDFTDTSLAYNTISLAGSDGNDHVDITGLASAHRVVFDSNGGEDLFTGEMRSQDSVILADGSIVSTDVLGSVADIGASWLVTQDLAPIPVLAPEPDGWLDEAVMPGMRDGQAGPEAFIDFGHLAGNTGGLAIGGGEDWQGGELALSGLLPDDPSFMWPTAKSGAEDFGLVCFGMGQTAPVVDVVLDSYLF